MTQAICSIEGCYSLIRYHKYPWCNKHVQRWYKYGNPLTTLGNRGLTAEKRFLQKFVRQADGCWMWTAHTTRKLNGYGLFHRSPDMKLVVAHRWAYEHWVGPIPKGLQLDHLCQVRLCVNPEHLEPVTARENNSRRPSDPAKKTHCKHGHPFDEKNTYRHSRGRTCRACRVVNVRRYRARKRARA